MNWRETEDTLRNVHARILLIRRRATTFHLRFAHDPTVMNVRAYHVRVPAVAPATADIHSLRRTRTINNGFVPAAPRLAIDAITFHRRAKSLTAVGAAIFAPRERHRPRTIVFAGGGATPATTCIPWRRTPRETGLNAPFNPRRRFSGWIRADGRSILPLPRERLLETILRATRASAAQRERLLEHRRNSRLRDAYSYSLLIRTFQVGNIMFFLFN